MDSGAAGAVSRTAPQWQDASINVSVSALLKPVR
jgi:hypothetical protein